jgi:hypothetical protein
MKALSSRAIQDFDSFLEMGMSLSEPSEGEGKVEAHEHSLLGKMRVGAQLSLASYWLGRGSHAAVKKNYRGPPLYPSNPTRKTSITQLYFTGLHGGTVAL